MRNVALAAIVLGIAGALCAAGCSSSDAIKLSESDALIPTLRVTIPEKVDYWPTGEREPGKDEPPPRPPRERAELGSSIAFADLSGPYTGDVRLFELSAAMRANTFGTEKVDFDFLFGLAYNSLDLEIDSGPQTGDQGADRFGPLLGVELVWHAIERLSLYGRTTYVWGIPDTGSGQAEAGLRVHVVEELYALLAWRHWRYRRDNFDNDFAGLDADIKLNGIMFGIQLSF